MSYPELENIFFTSLNILSLILSNTIKLSSLNIVSSDIADNPFINFSIVEFFSNT